MVQRHTSRAALGLLFFSLPLPKFPISIFHTHTLSLFLLLACLGCVAPALVSSLSTRPAAWRSLFAHGCCPRLRVGNTPWKTTATSSAWLRSASISTLQSCSTARLQGHSPHISRLSARKAALRTSSREIGREKYETHQVEGTQRLKAHGYVPSTSHPSLCALSFLSFFLSRSLSSIFSLFLPVSCLRSDFFRTFYPRTHVPCQRACRYRKKEQN